MLLKQLAVHSASQHHFETTESEAERAAQQARHAAEDLALHTLAHLCSITISKVVL